MSDKITLADLRVYTDEELAYPSHERHYQSLVKLTRPVTLDDLIQVLEGKGAKRVELKVVDRLLGDPGSYLVLPLNGVDG